MKTWSVMVLAAVLVMGGCASRMLDRDTVFGPFIENKIDYGKGALGMAPELAYCFDVPRDEAIKELNDISPPIIKEGLKKIPHSFPAEKAQGYGDSIDRDIYMVYINNHKSKFFPITLGHMETNACVALKKKWGYMFYLK